MSTLFLLYSEKVAKRKPVALKNPENDVAVKSDRPVSRPQTVDEIMAMVTEVVARHQEAKGHKRTSVPQKQNHMIVCDAANGMVYTITQNPVRASRFESLPASAQLVGKVDSSDLVVFEDRRGRMNWENRLPELSSNAKRKNVQAAGEMYEGGRFKL